MNKTTRYIVLLVLSLLSVHLRGQETIQLFPDRTSCLSGDTLWFDAVLFSSKAEKAGTVLHIQLDNLAGNHIAKTSVVYTHAGAAGFLYIPDSLSTGVYVLKAFSNVQKGRTETIVNQRFLMVYNRFDEDIYSIEMPTGPLLAFEPSSGISISAEPAKNTANTSVRLGIDKNLCGDLEELIVCARVADPLSEEFAAQYAQRKIRTANVFMPVEEKNGVLISGRVLENEGKAPVISAPILLSIPDSIPYFDYCITDEWGRFYFYVRNAIGRGDIVLQEASEKARDHQIELFENFVETEANPGEEKVLTLAQKNYASDLVKASYFGRLFGNRRVIADDYFAIEPEFHFPFYGQPTKSYYPGLFFDLPDFQEISREILHGVQYRERKGEITIRLLNNGDKSMFQTEPLKLIDGIPVFDQNVIAQLSTPDIKKVDAVFFKRYFGDLSFNGVLAIYSNKPSLGWVESRPDMHVFNYHFIQPASAWSFANRGSRAGNLPDFNYVLFRHRLKEVPESYEFSFNRSDIEGKIVVEVIAVCKNQSIVRHAETFNF